MAQRKLTEDEKRQLFQELLQQDNNIEEAGRRKRNFNAEVSKEIKGYEATKDHVRQQLNDGMAEYDPQLELPKE